MVYPEPPLLVYTPISGPLFSGKQFLHTAEIFIYCSHRNKQPNANRILLESLELSAFEALELPALRQNVTH